MCVCDIALPASICLDLIVEQYVCTYGKRKEERAEKRNIKKIAIMFNKIDCRLHSIKCSLNMIVMHSIIIIIKTRVPLIKI